MTGSDRLVLTGGAALNAAANMRVLEHFDAGYYGRVLKRSTRLHLWTPPVPNDAGVTVGAAYAFAAAAGMGLGPSLQHAFYCGRAPRMSFEISKPAVFALEVATRGHLKSFSAFDPSRKSSTPFAVTYEAATLPSGRAKLLSSS